MHKLETQLPGTFPGKNTRLFAFGDSFTYGTSLCTKHDDMFLEDACDYAWPQLASTNLNIPCHNLARSGASFLETAYHIQSNIHHIQKDDIVVIMWPFAAARTMILDDDHNLLRIGPWSIGGTEPHNTIGSAHYDNSTSEHQLVFHVQLITKFCDSVLRERAHTVIHTNIDHRHPEVSHALYLMGIQHQLNLYDPEIYPVYAHDKGHYSREQHAEFAKKLTKLIKETH